MATKTTLASPANFAGSALITEFPSLGPLGWATFVGDGSLNAQDGTNLAGTGAFTNVGAGPTLSPAWGRFTNPTAGWQTPMLDAPAMTVISVNRFVSSFAIAAGSYDGTFQNVIQATGAGYQAIGQAGINGAAISGGVFAGQWICIAMTKGPNGALGTMQDLSHGLSGNSAAVSSGLKNSAAWQIGCWQNTPGGYTSPIDIAFSMGVPIAMSAAQLTQACNSLRGILATRGVAVV